MDQLLKLRIQTTLACYSDTDLDKASRVASEILNEILQERERRWMERKKAA